MVNLSFNPQALSFAQRIYNELGMWVPSKVKEMMGEKLYAQLNAETKYALSLITNDYFQEAYKVLNTTQGFDTIPLEEINIMCKHYSKMYKVFGKPSKFFVNYDFASLGITKMDTLCYCRNLEPPFDVYNKGRFIDGSDLYKLIKKGSQQSIIYTARVPYVKYESQLKSEDIKVEKDDFATGDTPMFNVKIKNEHLGTPNRFAIAVSTKPPLKHCGCFVIINGAGNAIYLYALEFNNDLKFEKKIENRAGHFTNDTIILGYGYQNKQLEQIIYKSLQYFKTQVDPRFILKIRPEYPFEEKINWFVELPEDEESAEFTFN